METDRNSSARPRSGRPVSAQSRTAWGLEGGVDNPAGPRPGTRADELLPTAMEGDEYIDGVTVENNQQPPPTIVQPNQNRNGCWTSFKSGIRCEYKTLSLFKVF